MRETAAPVRRTKVSSTLSLRRKLALSGIAGLMALLLLEIGIRVVAPHDLDFYNGAKIMRPSTRPGQRHELIPNSASDSYIGVPVRINSIGLRDREIVLPKPHDAFRVLALGDSVTFGFGVRLEDTYVKRLEARLQAAAAGSSSRPEVINSGMEATGLDYYYHFLRTMGPQIEPDLVLVGLALNDIGETKQARERAPRGWAASKGFRRVNSFMRSHSQLYLSVYRQVKTLAYRYGAADINRMLQYELVALGPPSERQKRAWEATLARLDELVKLARSRHSPLVLVVFPMEVQLSPEMREMYRRELGFRLDDEAVFGDPQRRLAEFAKTRDVPLVDLLPRFRQHRGEPLFLRNQAISHDWAHPSPVGHDLAADEIYQALRQEGLAPVTEQPRIAASPR